MLQQDDAATFTAIDLGQAIAVANFPAEFGADERFEEIVAELDEHRRVNDVESLQVLLVSVVVGGGGGLGG